MYTVGRLAAKHGLSRSTLLYYERFGLLRPCNHNKGDYRQYGEMEDSRLERICQYRKAGISLAVIKGMLEDGPANHVVDALEQRLQELNEEQANLRSQQELVIELLGRPDLLQKTTVMDKKRWSGLLRSAGFSEEDMRQWHIQFERNNPEKHDAFLRQIAIPQREISAIRAMAAAPHQILKINQSSGKFMQMFFKIYEGLKREGPGSPAMTKKAYDMCKGLSDHPRILEAGCGSGGATMTLARISNGTIVATEIYQPFLDVLQKRLDEAGFGDRVTPCKMDMAKLEFEPEQFDLIWCEGAAYIMGVDEAMAYWKQFLKPGGFLAFSDAVWLSERVRDSAETELKDFWAEGYPAMRTVRETEASAVSAGYTSHGHFIIDTACWVDFYADVDKRLDAVEPLYGDDPDGRAIIDMSRKEKRLFDKYPDTYGYAFYVLKKSE